MDITAFIASRREILLISDHNAYRSQISRQILAARKRLGIATRTREKFAYKPITADNIGSNREYAYLLILTAERAWAHAMHIKASHAEETTGRGITGNTRSHLLSRLHKAAQISEELVKLLIERSTSDATEQDVLESRAYASLMSGAEEFEKQSRNKPSKDGQPSAQRWQECLRRYSEARVIYAALLQHDRRDLFKEMLAGTVDPIIRFVAYQARLSRTIAIATVAKQHFPRDNTDLVHSVEELDQYALKDKPAATSEQGKQDLVLDVPDTITFRGRKANIVDASIGQALAFVSVAKVQLATYLSAHPHASNKDRASAYDDILVASQDAADATKRATDELEKEDVDESEARMQDLRVTSLAVNFDLVGWRVGRNRVLIGHDDGLTFEPQQQKKPKKVPENGSRPQKQEARAHKLGRLRERIVLYDATIQSIDSVRDLRGAMRDASFVEELDNAVRYFRALKCLNISHSHSILGNHINALALLQRAHDLAKEVRAGSSISREQDPPSLKLSSKAPAALVKHISSTLSRTHALVEMQKMESESAAAAVKYASSAAPLIENLSSYPTPGTQVDLTNLVAYPPRIEPIPVKPMFLDVAWNYIDYPSRKTVAAAAGQQPKQAPAAAAAAAVFEDEPAPQPEKKRGWFGFSR